MSHKGKVWGHKEHEKDKAAFAISFRFADVLNRIELVGKYYKNTS